MVIADAASHKTLGVFINVQSFCGTVSQAKPSTKTNTKQVLTVSPKSPEISARPFFAMIEVNPAKNIEMKA